MPYIKKEYICGDVIEVEKIHTGRYGAPGQRRQKKKKPTREEVAKQNEINAVKRLRRKMNCNFGPGDYHMTLTYKKELRPEPPGARNILSQFLKKLRAVYKKHGADLKYIVTTEYKSKAIHHHLVINNVEQVNVTSQVASLWKFGRPKFTVLDDTGDYSQLADYFIKETGKSFREDDNPNKTRYSCSRNLREPVVRKKILLARSWRKEPRPKEGWYIDKNSFYEGVNPVTGYRYQYYTMRRIKRGKDR